jgi:hypothetical protein
MMIAAVVTTRHQQRRYDHPPSLGPPKGTRQGRFNYEKVTSPVFESPKGEFGVSVRPYAVTVKEKQKQVATATP